MTTAVSSAQQSSPPQPGQVTDAESGKSSSAAIESTPWPAPEVSSTTAAVTPDQGTKPAIPHSAFWLTRRDQITAGTLTLVFLIIVAVRTHGMSSRNPEAQEQAPPLPGYDVRIDLNSAAWYELTLLEGIGDVLARRIVSDREQNGPFRAIDDLDRVWGIGPVTVEKNRRWLRVGPIDESEN